MRFLGAVVAALCLLGLTPAQERGQQLYLRGEATSGRAIMATVGVDGAPFAAAIVPCVNCHGEAGRGRAEANVRAADITPGALAAAATVNGRARPPYTRARLKRAIGLGFDSAGNPLNAAMPRYQLTQDEVSDLLDFLAVLGGPAPPGGTPGVTDDAIRIGIVDPDRPDTPDTPDAPDSLDALTAPTARIYGRRIELVHGRSPDVFLRIDAAEDAAAGDGTADDGVPTIVVRSFTASVARQQAALRGYARSIGAETVLAADCSAPGGGLMLITADVAARCDVASLPADRTVIVAAGRPPSSAVLALATGLLARLGRDLTRSTLRAALERQAATGAVWLMTLDVQNERLLAEPGWVAGWVE